MSFAIHAEEHGIRMLLAEKIMFLFQKKKSPKTAEASMGISNDLAIPDLRSGTSAVELPGDVDNERVDARERSAPLERVYPAREAGV